MALDVIGLSLAKSYTSSSLEGAGALKGEPGISAYDVAVLNGFTGTESEWLESLKGDKGQDGTDGIYVISMNISEDNKVTALLSNGDTLQIGSLHTIKGDKGDAGEIPRIDEETKRWFIGDYDTGYVAVPNTEINFNDLIDVPNIPTALSELVNDEEFIKSTVDNLLNYYTKTEIYTKEEVTNLISNINRLTTSIVEKLPTDNISTTTIYLISAQESVYNQYMYIDGEWVILGNTNIDLNGYVTSNEIDTVLAAKSDINHTHDKLHSHRNKALLDTITSELIQKWNSKFSGNYNDLSNKPTIPIVTNDLSNELKEKYDDAVDKKHTHKNLSILEKFSESANGKPLYNNNPIAGNTSGLGTVTSVNSKSPDNDGNVLLKIIDMGISATTDELNHCQGASSNIQTQISTLSNSVNALKDYVEFTDTDYSSLSDIYGVEVDFVNNTFTRIAGAASRTAGDGFGGRRRCNLTDDGVVVAYYGDPAFSTTGFLTKEVTINSNTYPVGTKVQVMVEQPKFYYKVIPLILETLERGGLIRKARYYVSDSMKQGFKIHPAFVRNNIEVNNIYLSAFEGTIYDTSASKYILNDAQVLDANVDLLCSISNAKPMSGISQILYRGIFRQLATNRGLGWGISTIQARSASQLLFMIEYASFNSQDFIGAGNCNKVEGGGENLSENTGATMVLGNKSGTIISKEGVQLVSYRGEENLWGNIWEFLDGINVNKISSSKVNIYISDNDFKDNVSSYPYKLVNITPGTTSGFISAFTYYEEFDWLFIAGEATGNSSFPVGDLGCSFTPNNRWIIPTFGGRWNYGTQCGIFAQNMWNEDKITSAYINGRLLYMPIE